VEENYWIKWKKMTGKGGRKLLENVEENDRKRWKKMTGKGGRK